MAVDDVQNPIMYFRRGDTAGQDALRTNELRSLKQNGSTAIGHQQVTQLANGGMAPRPLVGSPPLHSVPKIKSDTGNASFCSSATSVAISQA